MLNIGLATFPVLTTDRLVLRQLRISDAEQVLAMRSDPEVMRYVNRPLAHTMDDALALIELIDSRGSAGESVQWAITVKGSDRFIGLIGFWRMVKEHYCAELGYTIAREHWGKGYATEAIAATLDLGFGSPGFHRVEAITRPQNTASVRALEKNGFLCEGHFREDIFWNGTFHDSLHFAKLAPLGASMNAHP